MRDIKEIINLDSLINYIGFANTPTYLYKHFKSDDSVANLSKCYSTEELKNFFMEIILKKEKDLVDIAVLYACIFGLILKPVDEVYDIMKAMQHAPLRWADKISALYLSSINLDIEDNVVNTFVSYQDDKMNKSIVFF